MSARTLRPLVFASLALALAAAPAAAQVVRTFTPRFTTNQSGDITLVGNTILSCNGGGGCTNGRNGTGGNVDNNDFTMTYVNADADGTTFSSSSATLTVPAGATVLWAGLYWQGESTNAARNTCRFSTPAVGYQNIIATQLDVSSPYYQGFRDVTALVQAGGSGTYWCANVYSTTGSANHHAGWALVVVYALASQPPRNLVVFDGFARVEPGATVTTTTSGFVTPPAGAVNTRLGVVAGEGDRGLTGDAFQLNGTNLSDALNPVDNFFNSTITQFGANFTAKNPNYQNQLGWDVDLITANGVLPNGATSATITVVSTGDRILPGLLTFATELYQPIFNATGYTKTVTDVNGGVVRPGDVLEYLVTLRNDGNDGANAVVVRDTLPANATYVAGSLVVASGPNAGTKSDAAGDDQAEYDAASRRVTFRLGSGATAGAGGSIAPGASSSVRFRVTVNAPAPTGTVVSNQAALDCIGAQSGTPLAALSDGDAVTPGVQRTDVTVTGYRFTGTVFEDVNYGGGAGRSLAASGGVARPNVRVELYDASGAWLAADTTDAAGLYVFDGFVGGSYTVRVVNATVTSSRAGAVATLLPVQTFRTDASGGAAVADANRVGGENPARADAAANLTSQTLASLTTATTTAQSLAPVAFAGTADLGGLDFGFNFDTIVNANDSGAGSLRQFLVNANALSNTGLAQSGFTPGTENALFLVTDGAAHPGLRAGLANLLVSGVVSVRVTSALPAITEAVRVDGATQTANVGDTNPGALGAGGTVGVDGVALATVAAPEVELRDSLSVAIGLDVQAANVVLARLAVFGFGNAAGSDANADVRVGATANAFALTAAVLGTSARAFADPGASLRSGGDHLRAVGGDNGAVTNVLAGFGAGSGLAFVAGSNGWTVDGAEIRGNAIGNPTRDGVSLEGGGTLVVRNALVTQHEGPGLDTRTGTGGSTFTNLTVTRNGLGAGATSETPGVRLDGAGNRVDRCVLAQNVGAGVLACPTASTSTLTRNSMYDNGTVAPLGGGVASGQIGIDLLASGQNEARGTSPFFTRNDLADADAGANGLPNFPVLETAVTANGSFTVTGWARPGSTIELFVAEPDPSGFGEGRTYVTTLVEGSASDLDAGASTYSGLVNGVNQGTDLTNRFRFTVPTPGAVSPGVRLTATATLASATSEFSGLATVTSGVSVSGWAYHDANHDLTRDAGENGTGQPLFAKLVSNALPGSAQQIVSVDGITGAYGFGFVAAGTYSIVLDDNGVASDVTPATPAGWIGTEAAGGVRTTVTVSAANLVDQNFGFYHGSRVEGRVFRDDGAGGGGANDGVAQPAEAGVAGARVRALSAACPGGACDSVLTDPAGGFALWLPFTAAGAVTIAESTPSGWLSTGGAAGTTGGTYARASDAFAFTLASGVVYSGLGFGDVPASGFAAAGARAVFPGAFADYPHVFAAGSAGTLAFSTSGAPVPAIPGWSASVWRDLDCDGVLEPGEPEITAPLALLAGQSVCVIVRHQSPAGATAGAGEQLTVRASFDYSGAAPPLSADAVLLDQTTIATSGGLQLTKSVSSASALPGDALTYTITYTNPGPEPLSAIVVQDATPAYTVFLGAGCGALGGGLTGCVVSAAPAPGGTGVVQWTLSGTLLPGGSGSVTFQVRVQ